MRRVNIYMKLKPQQKGLKIDYLIENISKEWSDVSNKWMFYCKAVYLGNGKLYEVRFCGESQTEVNYKINVFVEGMKAGGL